MLRVPKAEQQKRTWSSCPNCSSDLKGYSEGSNLPIYKCPFCEVAIVPIWWQRYVFVALGLLLSFAAPFALGIRGIMQVLFIALLCIIPCIVAGYFLVFQIIPPRYEHNDTTVTTLFHH